MMGQSWYLYLLLSSFYRVLSWVVFLFFWDTLFYFILFQFYLFGGFSFQYSQLFVGFLFFECSDLGVRLIPSYVVCCFSLLGIFFNAKFHSSILTVQSVLGFSILFHFWQNVLCRPRTSCDWSYDLLSLSPAVHLLRMWLSGQMALTNCNGDSAST